MISEAIFIFQNVISPVSHRCLTIHPSHTLKHSPNMHNNQSREGLPITVSSKVLPSDSGIQPDTVEDHTAKESSRVYIITKNTILAEMKTLAKYDRKVLEMGSKAFMSFLKVRQCLCQYVCLHAYCVCYVHVYTCVCAHNLLLSVFVGTSMCLSVSLLACVCVCVCASVHLSICLRNSS